MNRYLIPLAIFILLVGIFSLGLQYDPRKVPSPLIDKPIPSFSLPELNSPETTFSANDLKGHVSLLNVWASWCIACRQEHPLLVELSRSNTYGDPYELSIFDQFGKVGIDFGVYGVPETYILDQNAIIRYKHIGPITKDILDLTILPLITQLEGDS
jgi:cytochrome c biogenesis protein CcmG/thiol:disulfide interchange protein DsbE